MKKVKSKESRQKLRRWTFEADIQVATMPTATRVKLNSVMFGVAGDSIAQMIREENAIRSSNPTLKEAKISIIPVPHETISQETMDQFNRSHNMFTVLDKALELCIGQLDLPAGHAARNKTVPEMKELFYQQALEFYKPQEVAEKPEETAAEAEAELTEISGVSPVTGEIV